MPFHKYLICRLLDGRDLTVVVVERWKAMAICRLLHADKDVL